MLSFTASEKLGLSTSLKILQSLSFAAKRPVVKAMATVSELALAQCEVCLGKFGKNFAN